MANDQYDLVAVCDVDPQRASKAADYLGLPKDAAFTNIDEMLRVHRPKVLGIATRTPGRIDLIRSALDAGVLGIHCEKPLSQSYGDVVAVIDEVYRAGAHFSYSTLRRFMPAYRQAKLLADGGTIGEIREVVVDLAFKDMLLWSHPHSADLLIYFSGDDVESVNAVCDFGGASVDGRVLDCDPRLDFARVRFKSGRLGLITSTDGMNVRITGTEGSIQIRANGESIEVSRRGAWSTFTEREVIRSANGPSGTYQAFEELRTAVELGAPLAVRLDEIKANQRILWAIATSALRKGATVHSDEVDEDLIITGRVGEMTA
ncbi:Gfo/Idh/MocA family oxidoreductase [Chelativorans sp. ZYF759]|nr:Gfo/Idh/MocA family oxidoreductase [Chelativorans sp. ZYF759]